MSNQQPMWRRPSGPKPRAYKAHGYWWADILGPDGEYQVTVRTTQAAAFQQATEYAKGVQT